MDLKNFIKETLVQIAEGIDEANSALSDSNALVNPRNVQTYDKSEYKTYGVLDEKARGDYSRIVELIEFDVALYASEGKEKEGGLGIKVASIGIGAQGKTDTSKSSESRIKFNVPMALPYAK